MSFHEKLNRLSLVMMDLVVELPKTKNIAPDLKATFSQLKELRFLFEVTCSRPRVELDDQ